MLIRKENSISSEVLIRSSCPRLVYDIITLHLRRPVELSLRHFNKISCRPVGPTDTNRYSIVLEFQDALKQWEMVDQVELYSCILYRFRWDCLPLVYLFPAWCHSVKESQALRTVYFLYVVNVCCPAKYRSVFSLLSFLLLDDSVLLKFFPP